MLVQPLPGLRPAVLGPVAERQQRLLAAHRSALAHDGEHLLRRHVHGLVLAQQLPRGVDEDAVVAPIATQRGQRDEHLAGVGDHPSAAGGRQTLVTERAGQIEQLLEPGAVGTQQRRSRGDIQRFTAAGQIEGAPGAGCRGSRHRSHRGPDGSGSLPARSKALGRGARRGFRPVDGAGGRALPPSASEDCPHRIRPR